MTKVASPEIVTSIYARFGERPSAGPIVLPSRAAEAPPKPAKRKPLRVPHPDQGALFGGSVALH